MRLSEKQLLSIRDCDARINIWQGAVRSGKSFAALWSFLHFCRHGPEGLCLIMGRTTRTIESNIIQQMENVPGLAPYVKYLRGVGEVTLFNRKIKIVSANDARAEMKIRGSTYVGALVDEITILPESAFRMLLSRLSVTGARLFGTTNPDSPYHWLKADFLDRSEELNLKTWQFVLDDNPELSQEYVKHIKAEYTGLWYQRFIEGRWVQAEGAIYDHFDPALHCIDFPMSRAQFYIAGVDYGTANAFACVLVGINFDSYPNIWVEDEYYFDSKVAQRQKSDREYSEDLVRFLAGKNVKALYIDPSAASLKVELSKHGIDYIYDAENQVLDGIRLVAQYLDQGTLKVTRKCKNTVSQFQSYVWDSRGLKLGVDKPLKENDHAMDALRYAIYSHFFNKDDHMGPNGGKMAGPKDLDRLYDESRGRGPDLPRFFQDPHA